MQVQKFRYRFWVQLLCNCCVWWLVCHHQPVAAQTKPLSAEQLKAVRYLYDSSMQLQQSVFWKHVQPKDLIKNLHKNITEPLFVYAGNNTNFCGYAAMSFAVIADYPLAYVQFMLTLYKEGKAQFNNNQFSPSEAIFSNAGLLKFKGELDINYADQMWFLTLADHFKGYINWLNLGYDFGDEDKLWAATNFAKFNRMLRKMGKYKVHSKGSDLIRPHIKNRVAFLNNKLKDHHVFLYLNNTILHKKDHNKVRKKIPTHFVALISVQEINGLVTFVYWDYGFRTLQQIPSKIFRKITYGITWCKKQAIKE